LDKGRIGAWFEAALNLCMVVLDHLERVIGCVDIGIVRRLKTRFNNLGAIRRLTLEEKRAIGAR